MKKITKKVSWEEGKKWVIWQSQLEKKWLASLLVNKKAITLLLGFLKIIGVEKR